MEYDLLRAAAIIAAAALLSAPAAVNIKGGRFYLYVDGAVQPGYYTMDYTAKAAAVNLALTCKCAVVINQPDLLVTLQDRTPGTPGTPVEVETGLHSVLLSWGVPTARENGDALPLHEVYGFAIEYGEVSVEAQGYELVIDGLTPGEHVFRIATIDSDRIRGNFSPPLSVVLP